MEYIIMVQQQAIWDDASILDDPAFFHIPRNGARSYGAPTLSMQVWDNEAKTRAVDIVDTDMIKGQDRPDYLRDMDGSIEKSGTLRPSKEDLEVMEAIEKPRHDRAADSAEYRTMAEKQTLDRAAMDHVREGRVGKKTKVEYINQLKAANRRQRQAVRKRAKGRKATLQRIIEANADSLLSSTLWQGESSQGASTNRFASLHDLSHMN